jgi:alkylation response protein AidB-like acyl-CoA dehydrogenase
MDFTLSDEQRHWGRVARTFAQERVRPRARDLDRLADPAATFPRDLVAEASRLGLRTLKIPKAHGGAGVDCLTEVIVQEELAAGDVGFGMTLQHAWREGYILAAATTDAQRERFLPVFMADETCLLSFALTEPHAGSDHKLRFDGLPGAGAQTRAVRDGDEWVINGTKKFITNGNVATYVILMARTDMDVPWHQGLSVFVVPTAAPGFRVARVMDKLGIRLNQNTELAFENCRIPADNLISGLNDGLGFMARFAAGSMAKEGAKALGVARAALEEAVAYARQRVQGGKPIAEHQAISQLFYDLATEIEMVRGLIWRAAWAVDHDPHAAHQLEAMAKIAGGEVAAKVGVRALEVCGGHGVLNENPMAKLARDAISMLHAGVGNHALREVMVGDLLAGAPESLAPSFD